MYCGSLLVKGLQSYKLSKLEIWKEFCHCCCRVQVPDKQIILKVWQASTLQHFDLQRPIIPLSKDLNPTFNIPSDQRTGIFRIGFAFSNWSHCDNDYLLGVWCSSLETVHMFTWCYLCMIFWYRNKFQTFFFLKMCTFIECWESQILHRARKKECF